MPKDQMDQWEEDNNAAILGNTFESNEGEEEPEPEPTPESETVEEAPES